MEYAEPFALVIFGPTGVGKTSLSNLIAQQLPSEVINMDVGQMYAPLSIGTAKPNWKLEPVAHHLFDIIDAPANFSVMTYRTRVEACMQLIWQKKRIPILVGGSGFYLRSLLFPPSFYDALPRQLPYKKGSDLWAILNAIDPTRACSINKNDNYRIERALTIWDQHGVLPSQMAPQYKPLCSMKIIHATRDRAELYDIINGRVESMVESGWVDEVGALCDTAWEPFIMQKKIIGYDEIVGFIRTKNGSCDSLKNLIGRIQQRTRHYAKRQETYARMLYKELQKEIGATIAKKATASLISWHELNLTSVALDKYISELLRTLQKERGL